MHLGSMYLELKSCTLSHSFQFHDIQWSLLCLCRIIVYGRTLIPSVLSCGWLRHFKWFLIKCLLVFQCGCSTPHTTFSWGGSYHAFDEAGARFSCCSACGAVWYPSHWPAPVCVRNCCGYSSLQTSLGYTTRGECSEVLVVMTLQCTWLTFERSIL
jgi:hypothetical protein